MGREAALILAAKGVAVRALVRNSSSAVQLEEAGVEVVEGDMRAADSLRAALHDIDRLILAPPPVPDMVELERNVIEAAHAADIRRLVKCSATAADPASPDVFARMHHELGSTHVG